MAKESSFDIVCETDMQTVKNALQQTLKEMRQRFDFKGTQSEIRLEGNSLLVLADDDHRLKSLLDILKTRLVKNGICLQALQFGRPEAAAKGMVRQKIELQQGIPGEKAKQIVKIIKQTKLKVQAQIQKDQVRVSGKSKDDLQRIIQLLKEKDLQIAMQFVNFR